MSRVFLDDPETKYGLGDYNVLDYDTVVNILGGIKPFNIDLYRQAMVHKSISIDLKYFKEDEVIPEWMKESNEVLELLGDTILNTVVIDYLIKKFPKHNEAFITRTKIKLIRCDTCAKFSRHLNLNKYIMTSRKSNVDVDSNHLLEDVFEAFVGALFKDFMTNDCEAAYLIVYTFISRIIDSVINFDKLLIDDNYKDILIRYAKAKNYPIEFVEISREGKHNNFTFTMQVKMTIQGNEKIALGTAKNKKGAEQSASYNFIKQNRIKELRQHVFRDKHSLDITQSQNLLM